jgi:regulatory protein
VRSKVASYWGIIRIENELKLRKIPRDIIERGIDEINEEDYRERFEKLADEKIKSTGGIDSLKQKARVYNYLASRGYESSMIMDFLSVK